mmetsp:Transcript_20365/g.30232  ORF Transcript_20365/g.30232 Transcript_20365/m.30232 type:complete len:202 (-) Transcript_20365:2370-2975(-)
MSVKSATFSAISRLIDFIFSRCQIHITLELCGSAKIDCVIISKSHPRTTNSLRPPGAFHRPNNMKSWSNLFKSEGMLLKSILSPKRIILSYSFAWAYVCFLLISKSSVEELFLISSPCREANMLVNAFLISDREGLATGISSAFSSSLSVISLPLSPNRITLLASSSVGVIRSSIEELCLRKSLFPCREASMLDKAFLISD